MFLCLLAIQDDTVCDSADFDCQNPVIDDTGLYVLLTEKGLTDYATQNLQYAINYISEAQIPDFSIDIGPL